MRALGIDVGTRRIGVALSDPTGLIAQSLTVIPRRSWAQVLNAVNLRRVARVAVHEHEQTYHQEVPRG